MSIIAARAAFEAGDVVLAMAPLVEAWRPSRSMALGELIQAVGRAATPWKPERARPRQATWLAKAQRHDPSELTALMETLTECKLPLALERLHALSKWPPDPRIARALLRALSAPRFTTRGAAPFWRLAGVLIAESADPGVMLELDRHARHPPRHDLPNIGGVLNAVATEAMAKGAASVQRATRLSAGDQRRVASLQHWLDTRFTYPNQTLGRADRGDDLLDAILDDPEDDHTRRVYADWLVEKNDPRGEFIQLQMLEYDGSATEAQRKRAARLLRKHRRAWIQLGSVRERSAVFERGFLSACELGHVEERRLDASIFTRELMTVRRLDLNEGVLRDIQHLAVLPHLRSLLRIRDEHLLAICDPAAPPLPRLQALTFVAPEGYGPKLRTRLAEAANLPNLRHLHIGFDPYGLQRRPEQLTWLLDSPLGHRLATFGLTIETDDEARSWRRYLKATPHRSLRRLVVSERYGMGQLFERTTTGKPKKLPWPRDDLFHWWPGPPLD